MKSKTSILLAIIAIIGASTLSSCKSRCHCPTFSKSTPATKTLILPA